MKKSFAAACEYKLPLMRKFGMAMPLLIGNQSKTSFGGLGILYYAAFCHLIGREVNAGEATEFPM